MDERNCSESGQETQALHVDAIETNEPRTPVELQQQYFESLGECDWVRYETDNRHHLLQNVAFALFGPPSTEAAAIELDGLQGYTSRQKERVEIIYNKICEQSKYSFDDEIYMSILLVVCARPTNKGFFKFQPSNAWIDLHIRSDIDMWPTIVFSIRKCVPVEMNAKPCKVFIDDHGRLYRNWNAYLEDNLLDKCVLIAPENGQYTGVIIENKIDFAVKLTVAPSPALGLKARVLSSTDTATTVASVGALGVIGVAAFTPVAPVVLAGAAAVTVTTGLYTIVRSSLHLHDRRTHEQSIGFGDSDARNSWLCIAASGVGLGAGAASNLLAKSAAAGTNLTTTGKILTSTVNFLRNANLVTGTVSFFNGIAHLVIKYTKHGEKPTGLEIFQFTMSTLFFFNAVVSSQTAQDIIENAQTKTINEYRDSLRSNRHRKIFDKVAAEARRVQGTVQGNAEVIQGIQNISNKDEFFASILRINKDVNQHKLRISMTADGQVNINNQHRFNPTELHSLGSDGRAQLFTELGPAPSGPRNVPTRLPASVGTQNTTFGVEEDDNHLMVGIRPEEVLRIGTLLVQLSTAGSDEITTMFEGLSEEVYTNIMTLSFNLLSKLIPDEIAKLKLLSPDRDLIAQIVEFVFNYMKRQRPFGEVPDNNITFADLLKEFFQDGRVKQETMNKLKEELLMWLNSELLRKKTQKPDKTLLKCKTCKGVRYCS